MNRLKSIFISVAISIWTFFSYVLVVEIMQGTSVLVTASLILVSALPLSFFIILLLIKPVARTSKSLNILTILIIIGTASTIINTNSSDMTLMYIASISLVLWLIYLFWYSVMPSSRTEIKVGNTMPSLTFTDIENNEISNEDFIGKKLLYMFYRGNWCPLCMAQIKEISEEYKELEKRGVEVLLISPQPVSHSQSLAEKMGVKFHFLTDKENKVARLLKIDQPYGTPLGMEVFGYTSETVLPTVIITNEQGKIIYLDQTDNYRIRPEPSTFLKVFDTIEQGNNSHVA